MIDQAQIHALKQRRAFFEASGLHEKAKSIDVEIAKLRKEADKVELAEEREEVEPVRPSVETAEADLSGVETADAKRARGRPRN